MKTLLGLIGPAGCGKDSISDLLKIEGFRRTASADVMKDDLCRYLQIDRLTLESHKNKDLDVVEHNPYMDGHLVFNLSIRRFIQEYGMDMRNRHGDDYWINLSVKSMVDDHDKIVVTDIRFQNEWDYVKRNGGFIIYISGRSTLTDVDQINHITEHLSNDPNSPTKADYVLDNSGTLKDLQSNVKSLMDIINE